jgi:isopentenyl diphosphate isomerase/L-lactate dehydrogenase-like FMN-dependent dehydrogenase
VGFDHGGRQLESLPATISVLSSIKRALPRQIAVCLDGGFLSGESIAKALACGADMVFCGKAFVYGAAAGGPAGVEKAFEILSQELADTLTQIGCNSLGDLGRHLPQDMRADLTLPHGTGADR